VAVRRRWAARDRSPAEHLAVLVGDEHLLGDIERRGLELPDDVRRQAYPGGPDRGETAERRVGLEVVRYLDRVAEELVNAVLVLREGETS